MRACASGTVAFLATSVATAPAAATAAPWQIVDKDEVADVAMLKRGLDNLEEIWQVRACVRAPACVRVSVRACERARMRASLRACACVRARVFARM